MSEEGLLKIFPLEHDEEAGKQTEMNIEKKVSHVMSCSQERRRIIEEFCVLGDTPSMFHVYLERNL